MPVTVVVGSQWGDEGKGKIIDLLSQDADIVARFQGGANAGHTVIQNGKKTILHLIPSGILNPKCICLLGSGMVIDPTQLLEEIEQLEKAGVSINGRLFISHRAHLIMPYHKIRDQLNEKSLGSKAIGVTGRGIGPAYLDKYKRNGIRIVDLLDREGFLTKLENAIETSNNTIQGIYKEKKLDKQEILAYYLGFDRKIDPFITDVSIYLNQAIEDGKEIICEGAQGTLLDIDWGTYPFVTSSNPTAGGAVTGLGIGPTRINKVRGVIKAYTTRVGSGPFPTEFGEDMQNKMRTIADEFGATTGRARRCGWFDAVIARFSARVNGIDSWALTKLDVLSAFDEIKVCRAYEYNGKMYKEFPAENDVLNGCKPVYETLPGWKTDISGVRRYEDLPETARQYIEYIERITGRPAGIISVGSDRKDTIIRMGV